MRMFDSLLKRTEQRAAGLVAEALARAERAVAEFQGIKVRREADRIVLSGRGLMRRWLDDVRLRFAVRGHR